MSELILIPDTQLDIAQGVEGQVSIAGNVQGSGIPQGFDTSLFTILPNNNYTGNILKRTGGFGTDSALSNDQYTADQGFNITGTPQKTSGLYAIFLGVRDNLGLRTGIVATNESGQNHLLMVAQGQGVAETPDDGRTFLRVEISSTLIFVYKGNQFYGVAGLEPREWYKFDFGCHYTDDRIIQPTIQTAFGQNPYTFENCSYSLEPQENSEVRVINSRTIGIKNYTPTLRTFTVRHEATNQTKSIAVNTAPLYLIADDEDGFVRANQIVNFRVNAGTTGEFIASGGTILEPLKWLAPEEEGIYTFEYHIGNISASTTLRVVPALNILGLEDGYLKQNVIQGETVVLKSTIPEFTVFTSSNYPALVTRNGFVITPVDAQDEQFGMKDIIIQAKAFGQTIEFIVHVLPMYPSAFYCGVPDIKWKQERPDRLLIKQKSAGGNREARRQNFKGTRTWKITYNYLQIVGNKCACATENCGRAPRDATRLDKFFDLVDGDVPFSLRDKFTGEMFRNVYIDDYDGDHVNYYWEQERAVTLYWAGNPVNLNAGVEVDNEVEIPSTGIIFPPYVPEPPPDDNNNLFPDGVYLIDESGLSNPNEYLSDEDGKLLEDGE